MAPVRIPRTSESRRERTYAQLVLRVTRVNGRADFEGPLFRCGADIDEAALHPTPEYPEIPLLIEFAGQDRAGRLHRRADGYGGRQYRYLHLLWSWNAKRGDWEEVARIVSEGAEWLHDLAPIVRRLIASPPRRFVEVAGDATARILATLDGELAVLEDEGRERVMAFLYDQFTARFVGA